MLIKVKYVGTSDPSLTVNNIYTVIALPNAGSVFSILDDNGDPYQTGSIFSSTLNWQLVSIDVVGNVQLYP